MTTVKKPAAKAPAARKPDTTTAKKPATKVSAAKGEKAVQSAPHQPAKDRAVAKPQKTAGKPSPKAAAKTGTKDVKPAKPAPEAKAAKPATIKKPAASGKPTATPTPKTAAATPASDPRKQDTVKNPPNPTAVRHVEAKPSPKPQPASAEAKPAPAPAAAPPQTVPVAQPVSAGQVRPPQAPPRPPMPPGRPIIAPRLPAKAETFAEGDYVVYPTHGVGKVERIATEEIAGHRLELIHITFEENRMTLRVPVAKARSAGLRKLANRKMFDEAMTVLRGKARIKRTMWSRRAQEYEAKINSGDPIAIAEVVRDLHRNAGQPDQSFSERQIYEAAMDRLAAELAALDRTDKPTAATKLNDFLKTII